jgi:hypothetical protein
MVKIESSIGSSSFEEPAGRTFQVPDATGQDAVSFRSQFLNNPEQTAATPDMHEHQMAQMKAAEMAKQSALTDAKRRVEMLIGIGRTYKDVKIDTDKGPVTYTLRSLKGREQKELDQEFEKAKRLKRDDGADVGFMPTSLQDIKVCTLKHGISAIDGVDIDIVLGVYTQPMEARVAMRQAFIEELDDGLTNHLFLSYQAMAYENRERFAVKTEKDAKEVAELIKKSSAGA